MSESIVSEGNEIKTLTAYWSSAYFFAVAILYLWGYWSAFNVNILEYISLSDVVKAAAYPIASVFILLALGALFGDIIFPHGFFPKGGGVNTKFGRWMHRVAPYFRNIFVAGAVLYAIFGSVDKWRILPVLIAIPVASTLKELGVLQNSLKSERSRSLVLFLLTTLPPLAYGQGALKANDIISGKTYTYVISEVAGHSFDPKSKVNAHLRYVGKAGDHYFLFAPETNSVLILSITEAKLLELNTMKVNMLTESPLPNNVPTSGTHTPAGDKN